MSLRQLMIHTFDHYATSESQDSSAGNVYAWPSVTNDNVACNFQPAYSKNNQERKQENEQEAGKVFFLDGSVYSAISIDDRITIASVNYQVTGKKDQCGVGRVYSLTISRDLRG